MNLDTALEQIAARFDFDADALKQYAAEDPHDGWDGGAGSWPIGSLWTPEGKVLYALTRVLQPKTVVELGAFAGCSTAHLAEALKANGGGKVVSVDVTDGAGADVPKALAKYVEHVTGDGVEYAEKRLPKTAMLVFEDMMHSADEVAAVWSAALAKLKTGSVIVSHDSEHPIVGEAVREGIMRAGVGDFLSILVEPSDCGLAIYRL